MVRSDGGGADDRGVNDWWCWLAAFHPPPNLPPERGEGPEGGGGMNWGKGEGLGASGVGAE